MSEKSALPFLVDGVQSIAVNNGIARILFFRLDITGAPLPAVELQIPMNQMQGIAQSLGKIK